jgi:hypothetical protein
MTLKKFLNDLVTLKLIVGNPQDLKSLLTSYEAALNSQTFFCHLLAALVAKLFHS